MRMMTFMGPPATISSSSTTISPFADHRTPSRTRKRRARSMASDFKVAMPYEVRAGITSQASLIAPRAGSADGSNPRRHEVDESGDGATTEVNVLPASQTSNGDDAPVADAEEITAAVDASESTRTSNGQKRHTRASTARLLQKDQPKTETSDLADFLMETAPSEATRAMDSSRLQQRNSSIWTEPPPHKKRGILSLVGLRKQTVRVGAGNGDKEREFDAQLLMPHVTKRVLPNGKSYNTLTVISGTDAEVEVDPWQPSASMSMSAAAHTRREPSSSNTLSRPPSTSFKLRHLSGRRSSTNSYANPAVRPVSSQGSATTPPSSASPDGSRLTPTIGSSLNRSTSMRSMTSNARTAQAPSIMSGRSATLARPGASPSDDHTEGPPRSPALSFRSALTVPTLADSRTDASHQPLATRGPSRVDSRSSLRTTMSAKVEFPGLMARAASAMSGAVGFHKATHARDEPSTSPPTTERPVDVEGDAVSTVSVAAWKRTSNIFVPVTVNDVEARRSVAMERNESGGGVSTTSSSPHPDSAAYPSSVGIEILRPSDFAGPATSEREHLRSKSRSMSATAQEISAGLLPPTRTIPSTGDERQLHRSRSKGDAEPWQGWTMPRDQSAVHAARSAFAPFDPARIDIDALDQGPLPHLVQRALSPPTRKRGSRPHSRNVSIDSVTMQAHLSDSGSSGTERHKAGVIGGASEGLKLSVDGMSLTTGSTTPVARVSPLRQTVQLPEMDSPPPKPTETRRSLILSSKATGPRSTSSSKSADLDACHRQSSPPSDELEADATTPGLGLRSSFGQGNGPQMTVLEVKSAKSRLIGKTPDANARSNDDLDLLSAASPGATLWGALEAMRAEFMVSELRAEQERARFRLLARRTADVLEAANKALAAAYGMGKKPGQGRRRGRAAAKGSPTKLRADTKSKMHGRAAVVKCDQDTLRAILTELRDYVTASSRRQSQTGSNALGEVDSISVQHLTGADGDLEKAKAAEAGCSLAPTDPNADWEDVVDDEDAKEAPSEKEAASASHHQGVGQSSVSTDGADAELSGAQTLVNTDESAEYEDDDVSSLPTDASTDVFRDTVSQATTLEDMPSSSTSISPRSKSQHAHTSSSGSDEGAEEPRADTKQPGLRRIKLGENPTASKSVSHVVQQHRSPLLMTQSPRSFGTISEDGCFDVHYEDVDEDDDGLNIAYDEDGPFGAQEGGVLYSLRSASTHSSGVVTVSRSGPGSLSLRRQRRCESMSTIVSEDARSELGAASSQGHQASSSAVDGHDGAGKEGGKLRPSSWVSVGGGGGGEPRRRASGTSEGALAATKSMPSSPSIGETGTAAEEEGQTRRMAGKMRPKRPSTAHARGSARYSTLFKTGSSSLTVSHQRSSSAGKTAAAGSAAPTATATGTFLDGLEGLRQY